MKGSGVQKKETVPGEISPMGPRNLVLATGCIYEIKGIDLKNDLTVSRSKEKGSPLLLRIKGKLQTTDTRINLSNPIRMVFRPAAFRKKDCLVIRLCDVQQLIHPDFYMLGIELLMFSEDAGKTLYLMLPWSGPNH